MMKELTRWEILNMVWEIRKTQRIALAETGVQFTDAEIARMKHFPILVLDYCE